MSFSPGDQPNGLVVDIGGTKTMVGIVRVGQIVDVAAFPTSQSGDPHEIISAVSEVGTRLAKAAGVGPEAVAVAVPGLLDRDAGVVLRVANLPFQEFPLAKELSARFGGVPVAIEHDANCGLVGEVVYGGAVGLANVVYLTVSTGIGVGTLIEGRILKGAHGAAGELGHVPVASSGLTCACGASDCLEAHASGGAIARCGRDLLAAGKSAALATLVSEPGRVTAREVVAAAEMGDDSCAEIVTNAVNFLVAALHMLLKILDPDVVLLGGGVMSNRLIAGRIIAGVHGPGDRDSRVRSALLGSRSVLSGAICFLPTGGAASESI